MKSAPVIVVQLVHIEGPMKGEIQEFSESEISIGRHPSCQVQFPKDLTTISRKHAMIVRDGNRFKMISQGANGTFVNGKRLEEVYLKDGDVLTISENGPKVSFLTEMKEGEEIPAPPPPQQPGIETSTAPPAQPEPPGPAAPIEPPVRPSQPEAPAPQVHHKPVTPPPQHQPPTPRDQHIPAPQQPRPEPPSPEIQPPDPPPPRQQPATPQAGPIQRVQVSLIIQLGPTLRSYKELPVTIGKNPDCDFVLNYPAIIDHHAQIFFSQDQYWVKDLTGQQAVSINGWPISLQAPLNPDDSLGLSASGPRFRFLGGGRLAEIEEPVQEEPIHDKPAGAPHENREIFSPKDQADKVLKGAKNVLDKFLKR